MAGTIWSYAFAIGCLLVVIYMSTVPIGHLIRGLRGILMIIVFTSALNIFFSLGGTPVLSFWKITITYDGLILSLRMIVRIVFLIMGSSVLTLTTSTIRLTDGIEYALKPLRFIGVPSHEIAMMMTIAMRFVPTLMEEMDKIMKAQAARGADFDTGGLIKKAKGLIPLLVPLFVSAIRRAYDLATAMEARCYRGDYNRTRMKEMKLVRTDRFALAILPLFLAVTMLLNYV